MGYWEDRDRINRLHELKAETCGHCEKWMKCTCPRERWSRTPTYNDRGCDGFSRCVDIQETIDGTSKREGGEDHG